MKSTLLYLFLFTFSISIAQSNLAELEEIVHYERKSAGQKLNFKANPNTNNYDITYHKLEFNVDPAVYFITGKVTTTYKALADMNSVTFDVSNVLNVSSVKENGLDLTFIQNSNNELVINLPSMQISGTNATVEINYSGVPPEANMGGFTTTNHNGVPVLWTLSEPFSARNWWPCKQDLNDKVNSIDVYITAPSQYVSVSNGIEPEAPIVNGDLKTTHFHHSYPIPAYLVAIAVTNYKIYNQVAGTAPNQFPIINYIYPETYDANIPRLDQTPLIMAFFESKFKPYPFKNEKYGHAQFGWGGGMEHSTVSSMFNFDRDLIAHEMAHQWFGDKITCGTWKDIWLNEGITEYMSGLVVENLDGAAPFVTWKEDKINNITLTSTGSNLYLNDTQALNVNRIFSGRFTYDKGSMVTNMLRWKLGNTAFFQALKSYLADPALAYGYAVTANFKSHLEAAYGADLTEFFNDWVYNLGFPSYDIVAQNWGAGQVKITVNQTQSDVSVSYFEMPLQIRLLGNGGLTHDVVVNNTINGEEFIVSVPFAVTGLVFDPNKNIISRDNLETLGNDTFDSNKAVSVYPVPAENELNIQFPTNFTLYKVEIYNNLGQLMATDYKNTINTSQLFSGVHFLKIETSEGVFHKNFIKK